MGIKIIMRWITRILALGILVIGLLFYFGYGNPLPFANLDSTLWENVALAMVPLIFIGLAVGLKYRRVGGWLILIPTAIGFVLGLVTEAHMSINLLIPAIPGILYLIDGYSKDSKNKA